MKGRVLAEHSSWHIFEILKFPYELPVIDSGRTR